MPRNRIAALVAGAALLGGGAGAAVTTAFDNGSPSSGTTTTIVAQGSNVANTDLSVGEVAKLALKSVVEVDATSSGSSSSPFPFGGSRSQSAEGTGWVYDSKGDIVTNQHVVSGASSVKVKFSDGSTYGAHVVGADPSTDVAVLHVDAPSSKLRPLVLADSSQVSVGDGVVAIGNPFGLDGTVTSGIVSAVGREISAPDDTPIEGAIQTDAAINHGNSGGPLLDLSGRVIGITSQIQSESGGSNGVGFAIPSNTVRTIADQLIANGKAEHAFLGITPTNVSGGVGVGTVKTGSAADDAGLKKGDVITEVDGRAVTDQSQLRAIIAGDKPGDTLTLRVRRGGATKTIRATLGNRPNS